MSDRLTDLQRQRALAQEQLAALDREIARKTGATTPPATPPPQPSAADIAAAEAEAETLLAQYKNDPKDLQSAVKRGCFLYFFAALGLLALGLVAFYFLHPH